MQKFHTDDVSLPSCHFMVKPVVVLQIVCWLFSKHWTGNRICTNLCKSIFCPVKGNKTKSTLGIRVIPPTSKTSPMSLLLISASRRHFLHGSIVRCTRSATRDSNLARVSFMAKCFGPLASTVIYGKLMSVYRSKTLVHLVHYPFVILLYFSLQLSKQSSDHKLLKMYYCISVATDIPVSCYIQVS